MNEPLDRAQRRAHNQRKHAETRRQDLFDVRGDQGNAEAWWDHARKITRDRLAVNADDPAWADLARTLSNWCQRWGGHT